MSKLKEKDYQYVYDAISESSAIQNLIKKIINDESAYKGLHDTRETENLRLQISQLQSQIQQKNNELERYKELYNQAKSRLEDYERQKSQAENLKEKEKDYKSKITELENSLDISERNERKISSELETTKKTVNTLKKRFEEPIKYLEMYKSLSYSVRNGLENVISDKNEISFIASCSNENNLSSIWEYAKDISNDSDCDDFRILSQIFDYFFDIFNDSLPEPKYSRDDVELGDYLDDDYYDRCPRSATSGDITEIILRGYRSENTGEIIHKSLVKA